MSLELLPCFSVKKTKKKTHQTPTQSQILTIMFYFGVWGIKQKKSFKKEKALGWCRKILSLH